jgi:hypothetical protein
MTNPREVRSPQLAKALANWENEGGASSTPKKDNGDELVGSSDRGSGPFWRPDLGAYDVSGRLLNDIPGDCEVSNFAQTPLIPRV